LAVRFHREQARFEKTTAVCAARTKKIPAKRAKESFSRKARKGREGKTGKARGFSFLKKFDLKLKKFDLKIQRSNKPL
jgi:hypothetical protein